MERDAIRKLSISELMQYLEGKGVSSDALQCLQDNRVSGLALLLVSEEELKEMLATIGDRAIVRDLLRKVTGTIHSY